MPKSYVSDSPVTMYDGGVTHSIDSGELLVSYPHRRGKSGFYTSGGPFFVRKRHNTVNPGDIDVKFSDNHGNHWQAKGHIAPEAWQGSTLPSSIDQSSEEGAAFANGPTGIHRARPGNPVGDLGQFLVELRDLPRAPIYHSWHALSNWLKHARGFADVSRHLGDEYLNIAFGWRPFVNDVRKVVRAYQKMDTWKAQIIRDNGKGIHRRRQLSDSTTRSESILTTNHRGYYHPGLLSWISLYGKCPYTSIQHTITTTSTKEWFVGRFRYYIPDTSSSLWNSRADAALFGVLPTPSLLWEVMPWSWLIDWFSNAGDIVSNASANAVSNETMDYAYSMRSYSSVTESQTKITIPYMTTAGWHEPLGHGSGSDITTSCSRGVESKTRVAASPFGFGITLGSLSGYQWSILAALGISRAKF